MMKLLDHPAPAATTLLQHGNARLPLQAIEISTAGQQLALSMAPQLIRRNIEKIVQVSASVGCGTIAA
jgi:hypothetical protein